MSIQTHPGHGRHPVEPPPTIDAGPVARVVAGSLLAGAVAALVLVLVVFPGATEATIVGSVLVGFGAGWAMLRALSVTLTSQPQRWATVPAVAMGATGLVLLVASPGDAALTQLNWAWPPAVAALVIWVFIRARRTLPGRGQWLLFPVLLVLAAASVGATTENVALRLGPASQPAPGATYDVDGRRLHLDCRGQGGPTVVLFSGLGEFSTSWTWISDRVSPEGRVCAYDRAGQGWSEDAPSPQDGVAAATDLHRLLDAGGEQGPYVLVGHSTGGPYALTFAARYPSEVAGMVLLDSSSPEQLTAIPSYAGQYAVMRRGLAVMPTVARIGVFRWTAARSHLPGEAAATVEAMTSTPRAARNGRDEIVMVPKVFEQSQSLTTLGDRPLIVLTASENLSTTGWAAAQDKLAALSTDSLQRDVEATHAGLLDDQQDARTSADAILRVLAAARGGSRLAAS